VPVVTWNVNERRSLAVAVAYGSWCIENSDIEITKKGKGNPTKSSPEVSIMSGFINAFSSRYSVFYNDFYPYALIFTKSFGYQTLLQVGGCERVSSNTNLFFGNKFFLA